MIIAHCVIFKTHLALLLLLCQGCSTRGLIWATGPSERALSDCITGGSSSQRGALTDCKLALTLAFTAPTDSTAASICIYYFITPTYFRWDHLIFFRLFTQVYVWLTARQGSICNISIDQEYLKTSDDLFLDWNI